MAPEDGPGDNLLITGCVPNAGPGSGLRKARPTERDTTEGQGDRTGLSQTRGGLGLEVAFPSEILNLGGTHT